MSKKKTTKKTTTVKTVEKINEVKRDCYTFIKNVSIWNDIYGIWERIKLEKSDLKLYWPYVELTSKVKLPKIINKSWRDCWC